MTTAYLADSPRPLSSSFFGFNNNALRVPSWQSPDFVRAVRLLNPSTIRFPGGTESNYWNWRGGGLIDAFRGEEKQGFTYSFSPQDRNYTASKLKDFRHGLELTNTKPIFVLNLSTSNLTSQLEMLRTAKNLGLPIQYIELGNELYLDVADNREHFPQPQDYAVEVIKWISAIEQEFPEAEIAVVGIIPYLDSPERFQKWNSSLLAKALPKADAIILHIYGGYGLSEKESNLPTYPFFRLEDTDIILGEPFQRWQTVQNSPQFKLLPINKNIWITEYNLFERIFFQNQGKKPKVMGSWAHGLYATTMSLLFLEEPRVELICNHQLIGNFHFASILPTEQSFEDPVTELPLAKPYSLSATGSALSLLGNAIEGMTQAIPINFANNQMTKGRNNFEYPTLYGWMFTNGTEKNSLILNLADRQTEVKISFLPKSKVYYETISGSPRDLVTEPGILQQTRGEIRQRIILPPYSVTKISTNKK